MTFFPGNIPKHRGKGAGIKFIREHAAYQGGDCVFWPFTRADGYGTVSYLGKIYRAHRYMCELVKGPPPTPLHQAAHSCGNGRKGCVNPKHLSWKTNSENQLDRRAHGTANVWAGRNGGGKITPEQDAQIRELAKTKTQMELADMFGVTHSTIQYRLYGGSYKPRREKLDRS